MQTLAQLKAGELRGITHLKISEQLTEFPMEILDLAETLEVLDLSGNQLNAFPAEFAQLTKLKIVFASNNPFTTLPEVLGRCPNLEMIGFKSCAIKEVPANSLPPKLRWLILTDNNIEQLPDTLGQCVHLKKLALAGNQLTSLPQSMLHCHELELVRISANQLTECPDQLLNLPKLAWFAFSGNPFSQHNLELDTVPCVDFSQLELHHVLGQGASGVISKATWTYNEHQLPDEVAVKVFKGEVTSDGYPNDELQACLKAGSHPNLVKSLAQVQQPDNLALIMDLIPSHYQNLGLPPTLVTCTRDTFPADFSLEQTQIDKIVQQMRDVFTHLHQNKVCHGDLYAHNTLFDRDANILVGDFGAASMYHMLSESQQQQIRQIEQRALEHFIDDLASICVQTPAKIVA
ncbi:hypothetical protein EQ875_02269 [Photobacterium damselae subsp. damselae]|uniref:leucine-rich repeat-containing protein kinase family protein n=1 Tax=Photobacterium damselae TaxID=38293 RepID=UPI00109B8383|nr:leucine-rich repeat-containing protein kinase family protein [Photobacterium damselae]MBF7097949.1 protein kinase [Photobacterium damselae]TGZ34538.1 hypothetical protein EQ875_02269 [Photobacterium damselae subsp. damselae]